MPPPHALGTTRPLLWLALAFCALALTWATLGKVDVVAVAHGRIVPAARITPVHSVLVGTVHGVHVSEGQAVRAGQLLLLLDETAARADLARLDDALARSRAERDRLLYQIERLGGGSVRAAVHVALPATARERAERELAALAAEEHVLDERARRCAADLTAGLAELARIDATLPLLSERVAAYATLAARDQVPRLSWLELEEERVARTRERAVLSARQASVAAGCAEFTGQRAALRARSERDWRERLATVDATLAAQRLERRKLRRHLHEHRVHAPVTGRVQDLAVRRPGHVVRLAEPLMFIVPHEDVLRVEASIANKDIGLLTPGQAAVVKVETYPFTRYGTVAARLHALTPDAVGSADEGLYYRAEFVLLEQSLRAGARSHALMPGMAVTVELALGRRRIVDYLLAPALRALDESLREP